VLAFFEVGLNNIPVSIEVFRWIDSESLNVSWGFNFDSLTVSMLIPVLVVSSLVHIYSIGYMSEDPHNQRFFSYLSLFTFMMVILVTANNYLLMFVGLFLAVYEFKLINHYLAICWKIKALWLMTISRKPCYYNIRESSETTRGIPYYICIIYECKGKDIVQGFIWIKLLLYYLFSLFNFYIYYLYSTYILYVLSIYSLFFFFNCNKTCGKHNKSWL
jgi:hypothetical protein